MTDENKILFDDEGMVSMNCDELKAARERLADLGHQQIRMEQNGVDKESVRQFYEEEIMPLLLETFLASERIKVTRPYKLLALSLGMSWEPLVLSISCIRPEKVMILYTEETAHLLTKVMNFTGLTYENATPEKVSRDNVLDIYKAVKERYHSLHCPAEVAIDYTGGTKAMSVALGMVGAYINADNVYVGSEYDGTTRRPVPGSERLKLVSDPFAVYGDLELQRGAELFSNYDYTGAKNIFQRLSGHVPDPRQAIIWERISEAYEAWDNLDFASASTNITKVGSGIRQFSRDGSRIDFWDQLPVLERQGSSLDALAGAFANKSQVGLDVLKEKDTIIPLLFSIYHNALRRERQTKLDMASLLMYRLLEMISQARLTVCYGIDTAAPDYTRLPVNLLDRYNKLCTRCGFTTEQALPQQISLLQGYIMLAVLDDPLGMAADLKKVRHWGRIRNNNIFAHGFKFVDHKDYSEFKKLVVAALRCFVESMPDLIFEQLEDEFRFIEPQGDSAGIFCRLR